MSCSCSAGPSTSSCASRCPPSSRSRRSRSRRSSSLRVRRPGAAPGRSASRRIRGCRALFVAVNVWMLWNVLTFADSSPREALHRDLAIVATGVPAYAAISGRGRVRRSRSMNRGLLASVVAVSSLSGGARAARARPTPPRAPPPSGAPVPVLSRRARAPPRPWPSASPDPPRAARAPPRRSPRLLRPAARAAPARGVEFLPRARTVFRVARVQSAHRRHTAAPRRHGGRAPLRGARSRLRRTTGTAWFDVAKPFLAALRPGPPARGRLPVRRRGPRRAPSPRTPTRRRSRPSRSSRPVTSGPSTRCAPDFLAHELAVHRSAPRAPLREGPLAHRQPGPRAEDSAARRNPLRARRPRRAGGRAGERTPLFPAAARRSPGVRHAGGHRRRENAPTTGARCSPTPNSAFAGPGDGAAPVQVLRHMNFNLDDAHLKIRTRASLAHFSCVPQRARARWRR